MQLINELTYSEA